MTRATAARILRQQNPLNLHGAELKAWCIGHARDVGLVRLRGRRARLTRHRAKAKAGRRQWIQSPPAVVPILNDTVRINVVMGWMGFQAVSLTRVRLPRAGKVRAK